MSLAAGGVIAEVVDVRFVYLAGATLLFTAAAVGFATRVAPVAETTR